MASEIATQGGGMPGLWAQLRQPRSQERPEESDRKLLNVTRGSFSLHRCARFSFPISSHRLVDEGNKGNNISIKNVHRSEMAEASVNSGRCLVIRPRRFTPHTSRTTMGSFGDVFTVNTLAAFLFFQGMPGDAQRRFYGGVQNEPS